LKSLLLLVANIATFFIDYSDSVHFATAAAHPLISPG
jgi:hypothetical protein